MKKISAFLILSVFLVSLFSQIYFASAADPIKTIVDPKINQVKDIEANKEAYLQNAWIDLLNKTKVGSVGIALNPVFKITLGIPFEVSLLFLFSLLAWIAIVVLLLFAAKDAFQANALLALGIALIIPSLASPFKIIPKFVSFFLPLVKNPWLALLAIGMVVIGLVIYTKFMEKYGAELKRSEKEEIENEEKEQKKTLNKLREIEIAKRQRGIE